MRQKRRSNKRKTNGNEDRNYELNCRYKDRKTRARRSLEGENGVITVDKAIATAV